MDTANLPSLDGRPTRTVDPQALRAFAERAHGRFQSFLDSSLRGEGKATFQRVSDGVRNNITWRDASRENKYILGYRRAYAYLQSADLQGMPEIVWLLPTLESQWEPRAGDPAGDFGYWQLTPMVVEEIRQLEYATDAIRTTPLDKLRSDETLSTQTAQIHLRRYWYYFAKVAKFPESDAWLFTITAFNWGSGNIKRMLAEMEAKGITPSFSNFYHYLYTTQQRNPGDISMRAAVEYLPNLWNIAQLVRSSS